MRARRLIFATAGGEKPPPNVSVEKQVELVSFAEDPVMVVATLFFSFRYDLITHTLSLSLYVYMVGLLHFLFWHSLASLRAKTQCETGEAELRCVCVVEWVRCPRE